MIEPPLKDSRWEHRLRQLFEKWRAEDRRAVPSFDHVLRRGNSVPSRVEPASRWKHAIGLAAALVLFGFGVAYFAVRSQPDATPQADRSVGPLFTIDEPQPIPWQTTVLVTDWESPTAFLLPVRETTDLEAVDLSGLGRAGP